MLLIRNEGDNKSALSAEQHQEFLKKCERYIGKLKAGNKLIAAQPLIREGVIISGLKADLNIVPFDASKEIQVGYYHILASNMDEAIAIAKENPEFEYGRKAIIEVRPIKTAEKTTGYEYPKTI